MTDDIELYNKSDRDLLVLSVQGINELRRQVRDAAKSRKELYKMVAANSTAIEIINERCNNHYSELSTKKLSAIVAGITTGISTAIFFIANQFR